MPKEIPSDFKVSTLEEAPEKSNFDQTISQAVLSDDVQQLLRKNFDRRLLPIICILYLFSYLDRSNIRNAKTAGAEKDLGLSSSQWTWVLNSLYIAYELFEWTTLFWKIFPAHISVSILCIGWGTAALCSGVVTNLAGLCVCRAFLGAFEVMLATGSPFYLSMFYQRKELAIRMALLLGTAPLAACFASALAYGIEQINSSWAPWRWLFVIKGAPTLLCTPIVFFLLPDSPETTNFLTEDEKTMAVERPIIAFCGFIGFIGYLILTAVTHSTGARYAGVWLACCGTFPIVALNLTWVLNNSGNDSKKGSSVAIVALVGQLTSFIGSSVFPNKDAPYYKLGSGLGCGFLGLIVILELGMHFALEKENKRRDRQFGKPFEHERLDISALGDEHPKYRYLT